MLASIPLAMLFLLRTDLQSTLPYKNWPRMHKKAQPLGGRGDENVWACWCHHN